MAEDWKFQVNLKIGNNLFNARFNTLKELSDWLGFKIDASPEMVIGEMARLEKKTNELYRG